MDSKNWKAHFVLKMIYKKHQLINQAGFNVSLQEIYDIVHLLCLSKKMNFLILLEDIVAINQTTIRNYEIYNCSKELSNYSLKTILNNL